VLQRCPPSAFANTVSKYLPLRIREITSFFWGARLWLRRARNGFRIVRLRYYLSGRTCAGALFPSLLRRYAFWGRIGLQAEKAGVDMVVGMGVRPTHGAERLSRAQRREKEGASTLGFISLGMWGGEEKWKWQAAGKRGLSR